MTESMSSLVEERFVRLVCDYHCDGVWNKLRQACDITDLPVSQDLADSILAWQASFDSHEDEEDASIPFDVGAHAAYGLLLARRVKQELPDWTVVYFDESKVPALWSPGFPRSAFEYEIKLEMVEDPVQQAFEACCTSVPE
jgi:hypothetical protein